MELPRGRVSFLTAMGSFTGQSPAFFFKVLHDLVVMMPTQPSWFI